MRSSSIVVVTGLLAALGAARLDAQVFSLCNPGALRTCNSAQIVVQPLYRLPFDTFSVTWRTHPGFGGPFVADTSEAAVDLSPRPWALIADPFILSGFAVTRPRPADLPHLLASLRGGRGRGGSGGRRR